MLIFILIRAWHRWLEDLLHDADEHFHTDDEGVFLRDGAQTLTAVGTNK